MTTGTLMATSPTTKTITGIGDLIRVLPTGTVFLFHFLNPVLTNNGHCQPINKYLSLSLILFCGLSCIISSFTDTYIHEDGNLHYGFATSTGIWPAPESKNMNKKVDLSAYKRRTEDFLHETFSTLVFAALVVLDSNTVHCFFPSFVTADQKLIQVLPTLVGAVSSVVFAMFPSTRHGIGYYSTATSGRFSPVQTAA